MFITNFYKKTWFLLTSYTRKCIPQLNDDGEVDMNKSGKCSVIATLYNKCTVVHVQFLGQLLWKLFGQF